MFALHLSFIISFQNIQKVLDNNFLNCFVTQSDLQTRCSSLVYLLLLSINNEYFMKKTYIPFGDLLQNILKEKN